jgi:hypothetical protein
MKGNDKSTKKVGPSIFSLMIRRAAASASKPSILVQYNNSQCD